jgi:hypothetical protein
MTASIKSYNIKPSDINFNSVAAIFEIKNLENGSKHISSLINLLKGEGMEILSMETRSLDIQEAMFIKNRRVSIQEAEMSEKQNHGFDMDNRHRESINPSAAFKAVSRNDLAMLDKATMEME